MKINKFNLTTFATVASLILVGCGGDSNDTGAKQKDDNVGNNSISINIFDSKYNVADKKDAIKRIKWVFEDGNRQLIEKDLISVNTRGGLNNNDMVVLGNNFQSLMSKDIVQVEGNQVKYELKDLKTDRIESITYTFVPIDLTGVTGKDGNFDKSTGLITALSYYDQIPDTVSFPEGSVCYVIKTSSSDDLYIFDLETNKTNYVSLMDWEKAYSTIASKKPHRVEQLKIGPTNQYPASRIVYDNDPNNENYNYRAVNYENVIYDPEYATKGSYSKNYDLSKGSVDCSIFNNVAADFIEAQILKYYQ